MLETARRRWAKTRARRVKRARRYILGLRARLRKTPGSGAGGPGDLVWLRFWELYLDGLWEPETKELLEEILAPGDLFLDIGAWIGPVTLWALECGAEVIAVEPDPVAAAELRHVVGDGVEIWQGALTVDGGQAHLVARTGYGDSMSQIADEGIPVKAWTLPEILRGRVPALVKMDVEGLEYELLPTVAPYLAHRNVPLQVALHRGGVVAREWFAGYASVTMTGTDDHGQPTLATARP